MTGPTATGLTACYPGSFDPPTIAHLAVVDAVLALDAVVRVDLVLSADPLGKPAAAPVPDRLGVVEHALAARPAARAVATTARLLVDVAAGYDLLVVGADKWAQVVDPAWYGGVEGRDAAVAALPRVVVVPRAGTPVPPGCELLRIDPGFAEVSSSGVRAGRSGWAARLEPPA